MSKKSNYHVQKIPAGWWTRPEFPDISTMSTIDLIKAVNLVEVNACGIGALSAEAQPSEAMKGGHVILQSAFNWDDDGTENTVATLRIEDPSKEVNVDNVLSGVGYRRATFRETLYFYLSEVHGIFYHPDMKISESMNKQKWDVMSKIWDTGRRHHSFVSGTKVETPYNVHDSDGYVTNEAFLTVEITLTKPEKRCMSVIGRRFVRKEWQGDLVVFPM